MKLEQELIDCIRNAIDAANAAKITNIIFEKGFIRGIDDSKKVIIFQDHDVPTMPFTALGINRMDRFVSRFNLVYGQPNFSVEATVAERDDTVSQLTFKCSGTKVDYRCANPRAVLAPKVMNDVMKYSAIITPDTVQFLNRGEAAMKMEFVTFISNDSGVSFEIIDKSNGDVLSHTFGIPARNIEGEKDNMFAVRYPMKVILSLFKRILEGVFYVGKKGMLKVTINGIDLYVLPQV
ncbi:MAG TPA: hypothetical protein DIW31_04310 [Bacteroidales bacterium]|nr:hypothetical protein [Bacteroidales bacterium]